MKRIEAIIRPTSVGKVCAALERAGHPGPRISQIEDKNQKCTGYLLRGATYRDLVSRSKLEVIAEDAEAKTVIKVICDAAFTGENGDVEIFVYAIEDVIRMKTGESRKASIN